MVAGVKIPLSDFRAELLWSLFQNILENLFSQIYGSSSKKHKPYDLAGTEIFFPDIESLCVKSILFLLKNFFLKYP